MVSKYGLDETLVYDRRNSTPVSADELWSLSELDKPFLESRFALQSTRRQGRQAYY